MEVLKRFGGVVMAGLSALFLAYHGADPSEPVTTEVQTGWAALLAGLGMLIPALENLYAEWKKPKPVPEPDVPLPRRA